jgi:uncharacterized protein (TIGR00369 family)
VSSAAPPGFVPFEQGGEFLELVGPVHVRGEGEQRVFGLRVGERHRNLAGAAHGGLLATLVDFSLGRAIAHGLEGGDAPATVSLTTDFLGPARVGDWLEAHTTVERLGGTLAFADCSLTVEGREVVRGRAVFAVLSA